MLEACVRAGQLDGVQSVADQVAWYVRSALQRPEVYFEGPKWKVDTEAALLTIISLTPEEEPASPDLDGLSAADKAAAEAAWAAERDAALLVKRKREAAALLLTKRLPVLLARKKAVGVIRERAARWTPWLARLRTIMGLMAAAEGRAYVAAKLRAADVLDVEGAREGGAGGLAPEGSVGTGKGSSRPVSPAATGKGSSRPTSPAKGTGSRPVSPSKDAKGKGAAAGKGKAGDKGGKGAAPAAPAAPEEFDPDAPAPPPVVALQQLSRAAMAGARGGAWHEVINALRHTWNVGRALLNADVSLMAPTHKLTWEQGAMPPPPEPPLSTITPAGGKDVKGGKGGAPAKKDAKAGDKGAKGKDAKGGKDAGAALPAERVWPQIWLQRGARRPNTARALRAVAEAALTMVAAVRAGAPLHTGVIPLSATAGGSTASGAGAAAGAAGDTGVDTAAGTVRRTGSMGSNGLGGPTGTLEGVGLATGTLKGSMGQAEQAVPDDASSHFSYGSDLQVELWFSGGPLDMAWLNKLMVMVLSVLNRMNRFHAAMSLGRTWLALSEGAFNESVLPLLLTAAPLAAEDPAPLTAAMEVVVRDKSTALDALHKVSLGS